MNAGSVLKRRAVGRRGEMGAEYARKGIAPV